ncbi:MAG: hypothetical protein ACRCXG_14950 [Vibrio sp.]
MEKIGESQVQQAFVEHLKYQIANKFGVNFPYAYGAFNGSQDRKYADYFSSVNARNILIEFKEFRDEIKTEKKKPLRQKLCESITSTDFDYSLSGHFISWRVPNKDHNKLSVKIDTYLPSVCPLFGIEYHGSNEQGIVKFVEEYLEFRVGLSNDDFAKYVNTLSDIATGDTDSGSPSFYGVHLTFDPVIGLDLQIFSTVSELVEFSKKISSAKPKKEAKVEPKKDDDGPGFSPGF